MCLTMRFSCADQEAERRASWDPVRCHVTSPCGGFVERFSRSMPRRVRPMKQEPVAEMKMLVYQHPRVVHVQVAVLLCGPLLSTNGKATLGGCWYVGVCSFLLFFSFFWGGIYHWPYLFFLVVVFFHFFKGGLSNWK